MKPTSHPRFIDETGNRHGHLTVLGYDGSKTGGGAMWLCRCDCGNECVALGHKLRQGKKVSCGCGLKEDLTGQRFGTRVAVRPVKKNKRWYWLTLCDCGNESIQRPDHIKRSKTCAKCALANRTGDPGEGAFRTLLAKYKNKAETRGYQFLLTNEEFRELTQQDCHYCGAEPAQGEWYRGNGVYIYNGIDRVDNDDDYLPWNCVPCCGTCNKAKGTMTYNEFRTWVYRVGEKLSGREG